MFCQNNWEELEKVANGTVNVLQFISTTFSSTSVTTTMTCPPTVWDTVSNLKLHGKKSFYKQLSPQHVFFCKGTITASVVHEVLTKLNRKLHFIKTSFNQFMCKNMCLN